MIIAQRDTQVVESAWNVLTCIIFFSSDSRCEQRSERDKKWNCCVTQYLPWERIVNKTLQYFTLELYFVVVL